MAESKLEIITRDLPPKYVLNEPEGGIGFRYRDNRFVSWDTVRFQTVVSTLYRYGVLPRLCEPATQRRYALEIGAGYGGLAHHLSNICGNLGYLIVDIPESLLFSASYLSLLNPLKRIYVYDRSDFPEVMRSGDILSHDFVLLPDYRLDALNDLRFDLVINEASLQEMRTDQVESYLDFIHQTCRGVFYSWNQDRHPQNEELSNLSDLLRQRFDVLEAVDPSEAKEEAHSPPEQRVTPSPFSPRALILRGITILQILLERPNKATPTPSGMENVGRQPPNLPYRQYICRPRLEGIPR